jgi:putative iron-only hydrogenase system regulator
MLNIVGIRVDGRGDHATHVQHVLTSYGTKIIGRFGVPAPDKEDGLIAIVMKAEESDIKSLSEDLSNIEGVSVNSMDV